MLLVHRIVLEDGVEHISRVNLRAEVTVVTSIVTTDQMAEGGFTVAPVVAGTESFGAVHLSDFLAEAVVGSRDGEGGDIGVAGGLVDGHIEDAEVELAQVEEGVVDVLGANEVVDDVVGDTLRWRCGGGLAAAAGLVGFLPAGEVLGRESGIVTAQGTQLRGRPAPVLQHLAGCLDEIPHSAGAVETGVDSTGNQVVNTVAQLVE